MANEKKIILYYVSQLASNQISSVRHMIVFEFNSPLRSSARASAWWAASPALPKVNRRDEPSSVITTNQPHGA